MYYNFIVKNEKIKKRGIFLQKNLDFPGKTSYINCEMNHSPRVRTGDFCFSRANG